MQRLRADQTSAVLVFELANRSYFATSISDRGDEYFRNFARHHNTQVNEQESGTCHYHVLANDDGTILGRFNLYEIHDGSANVGYRVAQKVAGRGIATAAVQELCQLAARKYGLQKLSAAVAIENIASRKVLAKSGFIPDGPARPGGHPGIWYRRILTND